MTLATALDEARKVVIDITLDGYQIPIAVTKNAVYRSDLMAEDRRLKHWGDRTQPGCTPYFWASDAFDNTVWTFDGKTLVIR